MNFFEIFILNSIYALFPIMIYLICFLRYTILNHKVNDLILDFCLISSFYLLVRFGVLETGIISILIFNVPLLVAYLNKRDLSIGILSMIIVGYYVSAYNNYIYLIVIEYIMYYVLYILLIRKSNQKGIFTIIFIILKSLSFLILGLNNMNWFNIVIYLILFWLLCFLIIHLLDNGKEWIKIRLTFKELEKEKQIRTSLFKITHEIKNPIAVCKGYLDMFDVNNKEHARKYIPIIRSEVNRTLLLLQDFLDCNHLKVNKDIMDINMLLEEVSNSCMPLINNKKINYIANIDENELYIEGDYERLKQVFINIIKNSIEAINKSDSYIELNTEIKREHIHITIEDNGTGMSKEDLDKIKEPFYTTKKDGTGLGVTLSLEIIKAHNGSMKYASEFGNGTKVEVVLPIMTTVKE